MALFLRCVKGDLSKILILSTRSYSTCFAHVVDDIKCSPTTVCAQLVEKGDDCITRIRSEVEQTLLNAFLLRRRNFMSECRTSVSNSQTMKCDADLSLTPYPFADVNAPAEKVQSLESNKNNPSISLDNLKSFLIESGMSQKLSCALKEYIEARRCITFYSSPEHDLMSLTTSGSTASPVSSVYDGKHLDSLFGIAENCDTPLSMNGNKRIQDTDLLSCTHEQMETFIEHTRLQDMNSNMDIHLGHQFKDSTNETCRSSCVDFGDSNSVGMASFQSSCLMSSDICLSSSGEAKDSSASDTQDMPSGEKLKLIHDHLVDYAPRFFISRHDYKIYSKDVVFVDNFGNKTVIKQGIGPYVLAIAAYRALAHLKYASVRLLLLQSTIHQDEGCVRLRWRVKGLSQMRAFMFWKFVPWMWSKRLEDDTEWIDGISTFYVDPTSGVIIKHVLDRIQQDTNTDTVLSKKEKLVQKLTQKVAPV